MLIQNDRSRISRAAKALGFLLLLLLVVIFAIVVLVDLHRGAVVILSASLVPVADRRLLEAWSSGLTPDRPLSASQWAVENIVLNPKDTPAPGPLDLSRTPYLIEILENLSPGSGVEKTSVIKGRQLGFTLAGLCFVGYVVDHVPGQFLFATASLDIARKTSKQKLARLIQDCPTLSAKIADRRSKDGSNTLLLKDFPGGSLALVGANSASGFRNLTARFGVADEVDGWPFDVEGEGDPLELFFGRFDAFGRKKRLLMISTPLDEGSSRIEEQFKLGDQRRFEIPCPRCGSYQPIEFGFLRGPKGARFSSEAPPESVVLLCRHCEELIPEFKKPELLNFAKWIPTVEPAEPRHRSYRLPSWYSPLGWFSWVDGVKMFLKAKRKKSSRALKVFTNTIDAQTWKEKEVQLDEKILFDRREEYRAEVPAGALVLTAGVDVQDDRLEVTVWGWGRGWECWAIESRVLWGAGGSTPRDYPGKLWDSLDSFLLKSWEHESGTPLYCAAVGIDTGGHCTQEVYQFCADREVREILALKGRGGPGVPDVSAPTKRRTSADDPPVDLFIVGTDAMKDKLFDRLSMKSPGPGYLHFPNSEDFDLEFFRSLTGEKKQFSFKDGFRRTKWVRFRRNDVLDSWVYGLAAATIIAPSWDDLEESLSGESHERPRSPRTTQIRRQPTLRRRWRR